MRRPQVRFGLATLLLVVTVMVLLLGVEWAWRGPYEREAMAIARFRELGANVKTVPEGDAWTRAVLGEALCQHATKVSFLPLAITVGGIVMISDVHSLEPVYENVNAELSRLNDCPRLAILDLAYTDVTDDDLRWVAPLGQFKELNLADSSIGDRGTRWLAALPNLETLDVKNINASDAFLDELPRFAKLKKLAISGPNVTWKAIAAAHDRKGQLQIDALHIQMREVIRVHFQDSQGTPRPMPSAGKSATHGQKQ